MNAIVKYPGSKYKIAKEIINLYAANSPRETISVRNE